MANQRVKTGLIRVDGLVELNRSLKAMGPEFKGELRKTNKIVADFVATDSKGAAIALGSTPAHVAPTIKSTAGALSAGVSLGGPGFEMAAGAEFGSDRFKQFQPWRGAGEDAGYFVYPTIRRNEDRIESEYEEAADRLIKKVGLG